MPLESLKAGRVTVSNVCMYISGRSALQSSPHNFPTVMPVICRFHDSGSCCLERHGSLTPVTGKHASWCGVSKTFFTAVLPQYRSLRQIKHLVTSTCSRMKAHFYDVDGPLSNSFPGRSEFLQCSAIEFTAQKRSTSLDQNSDVTSCPTANPIPSSTLGVLCSLFSFCRNS